MERIDNGAELMRKWGVPEWPTMDAEYYLWDDCCVFAIMRHDNIADLHMAMAFRRRGESLKALREMLAVLMADKTKEARAYIEDCHPLAVKLAERSGFVLHEKFTGIRHDGRQSKVLDMRRSLWVG